MVAEPGPQVPPSFTRNGKEIWAAPCGENRAAVIDVQRASRIRRRGVDDDGPEGVDLQPNGAPFRIKPLCNRQKGKPRCLTRFLQ